MVHPRQLSLTIHPASLQVEATSASLLRRCSRVLISGTASGIARYATIVSDTRPGDQISSKEPHPFQSPYPYPTHPKPTPHQIFHLGPGATQHEIKKRCTSSIHILFSCIQILYYNQQRQTTISFAHTIQIHLMPVFLPIIQQKPIRDFDLSKQLTIFCKDARYRQTLTLAHRRPRKILIHICMN